MNAAAQFTTPLLFGIYNNICLLQEEEFMTEVLAVFRSRSQALDCNMRLKQFGVPATLINTPKDANIGCGLSVKFSQNFLPRAKAVIRGGNYSAFYGFYVMKNVYGRSFFGKI